MSDGTLLYGVRAPRLTEGNARDRADDLRISLDEQAIDLAALIASPPWTACSDDQGITWAQYSADMARLKLGQICSEAVEHFLATLVAEGRHTREACMRDEMADAMRNVPPVEVGETEPSSQRLFTEVLAECSDEPDDGLHGLRLTMAEHAKRLAWLIECSPFHQGDRRVPETAQDYAFRKAVETLDEIAEVAVAMHQARLAKCAPGEIYPRDDYPTVGYRPGMFTGTADLHRSWSASSQEAVDRRDEDAALLSAAAASAIHDDALILGVECAKFSSAFDLVEAWRAAAKEGI